MSDEIGVLARGLSVLEQLGEPKRISDLTSLTELPKSTVHRLVAALRHDGWVAQNPDFSYRRGWRWKSITGEIGPASDIDGEIFERLSQFKERTSMTMGFSFFRGSTMYCDMRVQGDHEDKVLPETGDMVPLAASATGRIILGALPDTQMYRLIEQERQREPNLDLTTVMSQVRRARSMGVSAVMKERLEPQSRPGPRVTCWASVILDDQHYPIAAVSAAHVGEFRPERTNRTDMAQLIELSHELTTLFGSKAVVEPPLRAKWHTLASSQAFGFVN